MHVLLTGGTGTAGRFIAHDLRAAGHRITLLARTPLAGAGFLPWQLGQTPDLPPADALVHAALDHLPGLFRGGEGDDPPAFWTRNFDGTLALAQAARGRVGRFVFLSSRAVYGDHRTGETLRETDPPQPDTLYGRLKHETEQALAELATPDFVPLALRPTGIYGRAPDARTHKWADLFRAFRSGAPIPPRVATELHGADLAVAVRLILERASPPAGPFNLSDLILDRHDLLARVQALTASPHPPPPRADPARLGVMTTDRIAALGWRPGGWERLDATLEALVRTGSEPDPAAKLF